MRVLLPVCGLSLQAQRQLSLSSVKHQVTHPAHNKWRNRQWHQ
jgi:hypothetical protein